MLKEKYYSEISIKEQIKDQNVISATTAWSWQMKTVKLSMIDLSRLNMVAIKHNCVSQEEHNCVLHCWQKTCDFLWLCNPIFGPCNLFINS